MSNIKTIICAVDFSQVSEKVAECARTLAAPLDAKVIALHVVPSGTIYADFGIPLSSMETFCTTMITEGERALADFCEQHLSGIDATCKVTCGDFAEEILHCAKESRADMVIMGTHGRTGVDRLLFGSVAEKVLRRSPCPVVAIRP